jgi:hypothetical protein
MVFGTDWGVLLIAPAVMLLLYAAAPVISVLIVASFVKRLNRFVIRVQSRHSSGSDDRFK